VAEGVETQQQAELLKQLKCPLAQGFLYGRPVPFDQWPIDLSNAQQNAKVKPNNEAKQSTKAKPNTKESLS
jgi:EAL domain-containing protein (putative c-di-GMP-specific phosphodiesterase class I)